jgi:chaperonin cofactor prefoldin
MQQQIDDLKRLLEEEKQKMGAAGKKREEELTNEIASLRKQLADRAARIDELKETLSDKENIII